MKIESGDKHALPEVSSSGSRDSKALDKSGLRQT